MKLIKLIIKEKPDLLFSTLVNNNIMLLVAKLLAFKKTPTIVRETSNRSQSGKVTTINKVITYLFYNLFAEKVIALSDGVKKDLINNFKVREKKIEVIYNPVEVQNIQRNSLENIDNIDLTENSKNIIAVGRLVEAKDYITLLRAFRLILDQMNVNLLILGEGPLRDRIIIEAERLNINNNVYILGFKDNPYKYINYSDIFVLSSKREGFSHVIAEAMAVGTPVVSTNCKSGPSEIIEDNRYGILVPTESPDALAEKVIELLNNESLRKYYIKEGLKRANDFDANKIVGQYENIFTQILQKEI